jgi:hypothetical protein
VKPRPYIVSCREMVSSFEPCSREFWRLALPAQRSMLLAPELRCRSRPCRRRRALLSPSCMCRHTGLVSRSLSFAGSRQRRRQRREKGARRRLGEDSMQPFCRRFLVFRLPGSNIQEQGLFLQQWFCSEVFKNCGSGTSEAGDFRTAVHTSGRDCCRPYGEAERTRASKWAARHYNCDISNAIVNAVH